MDDYEPKLIKLVHMKDLVDLWHASRACLAGQDDSKHGRLVWASRQFKKAHPEYSTTKAYLELQNFVGGYGHS